MSFSYARRLGCALGTALLALGMTAGAQEEAWREWTPEEPAREEEAPEEQAPLGRTPEALEPGLEQPPELRGPGERPVEDGRFIRLDTPTQELTVQVTPTFVIGPDLRLVRDENEVHGRAFGRSVFISLDAGEDDAEGLIGTLPAWFTFGRQEDVPLRMEGIVGGGPVQLTVTSEEITGTVGMCTYELEYQQDAALYEGTRVCAGTPWQTVSLGLPPRLLEQADPMTVMALVVLLGA